IRRPPHAPSRSCQSRRAVIVLRALETRQPRALRPRSREPRARKCLSALPHYVLRCSRLRLRGMFKLLPICRDELRGALIFFSSRAVAPAAGTGGAGRCAPHDSAEEGGAKGPIEVAREQDRFAAEPRQPPRSEDGVVHVRASCSWKRLRALCLSIG